MIEVKFSGNTASEVNSQISSYLNLLLTALGKPVDAGPNLFAPAEKPVTKRGPKPKEIVVPVEATAPAAVVEVESKEDTPQSSPSVTPVSYPTHEATLLAVKSITDTLGMEKGLPIGRDALAKFGYKRVSEVKPEDREALIAHVKNLIEAHSA